VEQSGNSLCKTNTFFSLYKKKKKKKTKQKDIEKEKKQEK